MGVPRVVHLIESFLFPIGNRNGRPPFFNLTDIYFEGVVENGQERRPVPRCVRVDTRRGDWFTKDSIGPFQQRTRPPFKRPDSPIGLR